MIDNNDGLVMIHLFIIPNGTPDSFHADNQMNREQKQRQADSEDGILGNTRQDSNLCVSVVI